MVLGGRLSAAGMYSAARCARWYACRCNKLVRPFTGIRAGCGMQDFRKLQAWQAARELTTRIYRATAAFPSAERFGLTAQMRAAAVSIGANLAEGCGRATRADTLRFFQMSF